MTVVFVHGNPETTAVWDLLADRLAEAGYDDQVRSSPPGFGAAIPEGFDCTVLAYRDWLIGEIEQIGALVHPPAAATNRSSTCLPTPSASAASTPASS